MSRNQNNKHAYHGDIKNQNASRVYINPNFQQNNAVQPRNTSMYINPQFHLHQNLQALNVINRPKIFVNPNFVRTSVPNPPVTHHLTSATGYTTISSAADNDYRVPEVPINNVRPNTLVTIGYHHTGISTGHVCYVNSKHSTTTSSTNSFHLPNVSPSILREGSKPSMAVAKSRYSLVRQYSNTGKKIGTLNHSTNKTITKMKINKYKTISLEHAKKQDEKDKRFLKILPQVDLRAVSDKTRPQFIQNRFKLIKKNTEAKSIKIELKTPIKRKNVQNSSNILMRSNQKLRANAGLAKFRKNNIPCPLFRKYGSCLRNSRGKCEFLHDKKLVSICRRFLKGICHDKMCRLSHEVTAEKMPTCSFYLKGMCTKDDCPYLHVKLNEKALVCRDFLKGYCEKGDTCLNRHLNICPEQAEKGVCSTIACPYPHGSTKQKSVPKKVNTKLARSIKLHKKNEEFIKSNALNIAEEGTVKDCRYYKEVVQDMTPAEVEVIKPTRCKLGALPSFIKF